MTNVLHVTDCNSGVASAIRNFVGNTPEFNHTVLHLARDEESSRGAYEGIPGALGVVEYRKNVLLDPMRVWSAAKTAKADVIHLHSSYAGLIGRLIFRSKRMRRLIYSPHCYAFERLDLPCALRKCFRLAEWMLARNTDVLASCSARELELSRTFRGARSIFVPNVSNFCYESVARVESSSKDSKFSIVGIGRLSAQKDPRWFAEVARIVGQNANRVSRELRFTWIGDGPQDYVDVLAAAGVGVTGWIDEGSVLKTLAESDVYLHSAAWEGFPVALLNAVRAGLPPVVRSIPATRLRGAPVVLGASEAAECILELATRKDAVQALHRCWLSLLEGNDAVAQREALYQIYSSS